VLFLTEVVVVVVVLGEVVLGVVVRVFVDNFVILVVVMFPSALLVGGNLMVACVVGVSEDVDSAENIREKLLCT